MDVEEVLFAPGLNKIENRVFKLTKTALPIQLVVLVSKIHIKRFHFVTELS